MAVAGEEHSGGETADATAGDHDPRHRWQRTSTTTPDLRQTVVDIGGEGGAWDTTQTVSWLPAPPWALTTYDRRGGA